MSFETYFYMFLSWYLKNPGHLSELLLYEVTEVSLTVSSSGSMTDTGPLNTVNTLYNDIPTTNSSIIQRYTPTSFKMVGQFV